MNKLQFAVVLVFTEFYCYCLGRYFKHIQDKQEACATLVVHNPDLAEKWKCPFVKEQD